jgi:hypothetical protein
MKVKQPKLYRQVYIAVWFENARIVCGHYDPSVSIEYFKARQALDENKQRVWVLIDELPSEKEANCMIEPDFDNWHYKNPKPYIPNLTRTPQPTIKEKREATERMKSFYSWSL